VIFELLIVGIQGFDVHLVCRLKLKSQLMFFGLILIFFGLKLLLKIVDLLLQGFFALFVSV